MGARTSILKTGIMGKYIPGEDISTIQEYPEEEKDEEPNWVKHKNGKENDIAPFLEEQDNNCAETGEMINSYAIAMGMPLRLVKSAPDYRGPVTSPATCSVSLTISHLGNLATICI